MIGEQRSTIVIVGTDFELGWRPRPAETTIVETAESLRDLGLLDQHQ
jgi:hypothetical protein